jgi:C-terminal processing protease CtpA/Prc
MKRMCITVLLLLALHAQAQQNYEFEQVKKIIMERYVSPVGQDVTAWAKRASATFARECLKECPKTVSIPLLRKLLAELSDPHAFISWPLSLEGGEARPFGSPLQGNTYDFEATVSTSGVVVTSVLPKGTADRAGLRLGDVIKVLNGQALAPDRLFVELGKAEADRASIEVSLRRGQQIRIEPRSRTNFVFPLLSPEGQSPGILSLPDLMGLNAADRAVHDAVHAINKRSETQLIIDLRQNVGGSPWATANAAGAFIQKTAWQLRDKKNQLLFHSFERGNIVDISPETQGKVEKDQFKNPAFFKGNVCVLIDNTTFSSGENFALLLQRYSNAHIVGETTYGGAGATNNFYPLFLGPIFSFTTHLMYFEDGTRLPTKVTPDQVIPLDVEGIIQGRDNQLEACQTWLKGR